MVRHLVASAALSVGAALTAAEAAAQAVAELEVTPSTVQLAAGQRKEVLATAYSRSGDIVTVTFSWSSTNPGVVTVEQDPAVPEAAYLVGLSPGAATVQVRAGTQSATISVTVTGGTPLPPGGTGAASVLHIQPADLYLFPAEDVQLRPVFLKDDGSPAAPTALTWRSFRPDVATVDATGRVVGIQPGQGLIEATTGTGLMRRVQVQVGTTAWEFSQPIFSLSPLTSDTIGIVVPGQNRRAVDPKWFTWQSTNRDAVTVSPLGVITAISGGRAEVVANGFGQQSRVPVTVHRQVETLGIAPNRDTVVVPLGGAVRFRATPYAADDTPVLDAPIYWTLGDTAIARFNPGDTTAIGKRLGTTTITVHAPGGLQKTWMLSVVAAGLVLNVDRLGVGLNDRPTLEASYADSAGTALAPAAGVRWATSNSAVVRVAEDGRLTPAGFGSAQVIASTQWGNADTATVFVQGELLVTSFRSGSFDIYALDRTAPDRLNPVTRDPSQEYSSAYSPDGSQIAFVSDRDGNAEIYLVDADGSNPRRLTTTAQAEDQPAWTPNGTQIVYQSISAGTIDIWIMNADGSSQRQLTAGTGANQDPSVSPDGQTIAFTSTRDGNYEIYLMNRDGTNQRNFTRSPANENVPSWIGDSVVAFVREDRSGGAPTRVVARISFSGESATLTEPTLLVTDFAVSREGDLLAVVVESPGPTGATIRRLYLIPANGGLPTEVAREGERDQLVRPAFRP